MVTRGLIEVNSPKMSITTTTTDTGDLYGNWPTNGQPYSFPFPGIVTKVLVNSLPGGPDLNGESITIIKGVNSQSPFLDAGPPLNLAAGAGLQTFSVNYLFNANAGFMFNISGVAGAVFSVSLEIEYLLV